MSDKYILDANGEPMVCVDLMKWGRWLEKAERHVGNDNIGDVHVSTVFLGLDHSFGEPGPPVLWETMIFGGPHSDYTERYTSRANAIAGHARAVALASSNGVEARAPRERALARIAQLEEALRASREFAGELAKLLEAHAGDMTKLGAIATWANEVWLQADVALAPPAPPRDQP